MIIPANCPGGGLGGPGIGFDGPVGVLFDTGISSGSAIALCRTPSTTKTTTRTVEQRKKHGMQNLME